MRYYVLVRDEDGLIPPYVVAEVVRERYDDGEFRDSSLGSGVGLVGAAILTRDEIQQDPDALRALEDWERQDDSAFDGQLDRALEQAAEVPAATPAAAAAAVGIESALVRTQEVERRAAQALVAARRKGMKVVRHRLAQSEPSDLPPPTLTLHPGGEPDG